MNPAPSLWKISHPATRRPCPHRNPRRRILDAKAADPAADVSALEAEIDRLVYQLYGLTADEIAIIEANTKERKPMNQEELLELIDRAAREGWTELEFEQSRFTELPRRLAS